MIQIKQREDKWRLKIVEEEWEFNNKKDFDDSLKKILELKSKYGRLNNGKMSKM